MEGRFPFTVFTSEVVALNAALDQILEEGLENVWARHELAASVGRAGVRGMGLEIWPVSDGICTPCVTVIKCPEGIDDAQLRMHMYEKYGVLISGGFKDLMGKLFRIGHMGKTAEPMHVVVALAALEKTLKDMDYPIKLGSGVAAALESF